MNFLQLLFFLSLPMTAWAYDPAPYKIGQVLSSAEAGAFQKSYASRKKQSWHAAPQQEELKGRKDETLIRYGIALLDKTVHSIGPKTKDTAKRYSGNSLNCPSCHLKGESGLPGTKQYAIPFTNVVNDYPRFRARSMKVSSLADRVNGCMNRSMGVNGRPFPEDSREMKAMLAYFGWLAQGTKEGEAMEGSGLPKITLPERVANPEHGKKLYGQYCVPCHGQDGVGTKAADYAQTGAYQFPPLAGPDSFNDGAGMSRIITATRFIYANMPLGAQYQHPLLTTEVAFDIAGYIKSLHRPSKPDREKDFPVPEFRPLDYAVPAYFDGNKAAINKAKYGPFTN